MAQDNPPRGDDKKSGSREGASREGKIQQDEIRELTEQFYITLGSYAYNLPPSAQGAGAIRVQKLLEDTNRSWSKAYEIEQLLVHLYDEDTLMAEMRSRLLEARRVLRSEIGDHYQQEAQEAKTAAQRRVLTSRLINDLQWRYTVNEVRRRYAKIITSRAGTLFVLALAAFAALMVVTVFSGERILRADFRLFLFAAVAGFWGATFSMLSTLRNRLDSSGLNDLKVLTPWVMLLSRALIGAGAASILYFFLISGVLAGTAFPQLDKVAAGANVPIAMLSLLIVWCFLAGFSERLVPDLLARTESRVETAASNDQVRPMAAATPARDADAKQDKNPPTAQKSNGSPEKNADD